MNGVSLRAQEECCMPEEWDPRWKGKREDKMPNFRQHNMREGTIPMSQEELDSLVDEPGRFATLHDRVARRVLSREMKRHVTKLTQFPELQELCQKIQQLTDSSTDEPIIKTMEKACAITNESMQKMNQNYSRSVRKRLDNLSGEMPASVVKQIELSYKSAPNKCLVSAQKRTKMCWKMIDRVTTLHDIAMIGDYLRFFEQSNVPLEQVTIGALDEFLKKAAAKRADAACDALCLEEGTREPLPQIEASPSIEEDEDLSECSDSEAPIGPAPKDPAILRQEFYQECMSNHRPYTFHYHVKRWWNAGLEKIGQFPDAYPDGAPKYIGKGRDLLKKMLDYHNPLYAYKLIDRKEYRIPAESGTGVRLICTFQRQNHPPVLGEITFGINGDQIHHQMFEELGPKGKPIPEFFRAIQAAASTQPISEEIPSDWNHVGIQTFVSENGDFNIIDPNNRVSMKIHAVRPDLLPPYFKRTTYEPLDTHALGKALPRGAR